MSARQRKRRGSRRRDHAERTPVRRQLLAAGGLTAGATLAMSGVAHATTFTVGSAADTTGATDCDVAANLDCTLRQAIDDADDSPGADQIVFNAALSGSTIHLTSPPRRITEAVSIQGPGSSQLTLDGGMNYRLFDINPYTPGDPVSISGLTLTNGHAGAGGAIYNGTGSLAIENSMLSGNGATSDGGGIYSYQGDVTVLDSTIRDGYAGGFGGGIYSEKADVDVTGSTISGNHAFEGGGIYSSQDAVGAALTVTNSTITDNHAINLDAGAIYLCCGESGDTLTVVGSTITGNTAAQNAGGIDIGHASINGTLQDSIVSGNTAYGSSYTDDVYSGSGSGYYFYAAFSLVGVPIGDPHPYVIETVPGSNLPAGTNPQLGPLQDNGGPTQTIVPASTSPVVNKGKAFGLTTDQRGLNRPVLLPGVAISSAAGADGSDMGAVELQAPSNPPPSGPTGQRSAAINKCKKKYKKAIRAKRKHDALTPKVKKHLKKKLRKCKRRANQLPV